MTTTEDTSLHRHCETESKENPMRIFEVGDGAGSPIGRATGYRVALVPRGEP